MRYEAIKDRHFENAWRVEAIDRDGEGESYVTVFFEPKAEDRAKRYADVMNNG